jgi:hypothetical protein
MIQKLQGLLQSLNINIDKQVLLNEQVSKSSIGWHIEHSLLTINVIIARIINSDVQHYKWKFSFPKLLIFTINKIPRGKAKAPATVAPVAFTMESLRDHLQKTNIEIAKLKSLSTDKYFEHPIFGDLKLKEAIKFLVIHTNHHLAIINDIAKSQ